MLFRRMLPATALAAALSFTTACGGASDDHTLAGRADDGGGSTIGIRFDQPGLGQRGLDGKFVGFDVDVAKYVAARLGVEESGITCREARSAEREELIANGEVDFVVATYSITDRRKERVAFAGPYFQTGQRLPVRFTDDITGPERLDGRKLCSGAGSTSAQRVKDEFARGVQLVEYGPYSDCVIALPAGNVDAVTTDEVILAGYVAENPELVKPVGEPFTTERYGVGLAKGDVHGRADVSAAIEEVIGTGEWPAPLERNIGQAAPELPDQPRVTERWTPG